MATTQIKQGRKGAGRDFVGDIRIMGSSLAAAASLSPIGRGIAEMSLQLLPVLQTTLDIHQLIGLFHGHAKQVIHHDSVLYRHPKDGAGVSIGEPGRHSCTYRLVVEGAALGEIAFSRSQSFSAPEISLLECLVCALVYPLRNGLSYKAAMEEARRDSLTGVYNRGVMEAALEREVGLAHRYHSPLSLIFMDIDYFKSINDTYGHTVGDEAIREFARCVNEKIRATDILSRYGGDEFVAILPNTTLEGADLLANRIREGMMQSRGFAEMARGMRITASIGIASLEGGETAQHLLDRADRLLNLAKQAGRDCVRRAF
jgi:diguanylate cyclase (GGDEF)-like protein